MRHTISDFGRLTRAIFNVPLTKQTVDGIEGNYPLFQEQFGGLPVGLAEPVS